MKILFVHNYFHVKSGSGAVMFMEADALKALGHEVEFFATDQKPYLDPNYPLARFFSKHMDYKSSSKWDMLRNIFKPFYNQEAKQKLKALLSELKPDIVHIHTFFYHLTPSIIDACHDMGVPTIVTIHGAGFVCPNEKLMIGNKRYCEKELCTKGQFHHAVINKCVDNSLKKSLRSFLFMSAYRLDKKVHKIDRFLTPSRAMAEMLSRSFIPKNKLTVLENSLSEATPPNLPSQLSSQTVQDSGQPPYFLYAGRVASEKGIDVLLKALSHLPYAVPLYIVGEGPAEGALKRQAEALNIAQQVHFMGWKSQAELKKLYQSCLATIVPSNWFEAFGLVVIESFSHGKPVIASAMGGIPELVIHNQNGLLVPAGQPDDLAEAIDTLYQNPEKAQAMGHNAHQTALARFQISSHVRQLITIYESVIR